MSLEKRVGGFRILNELASGTGSQGSVVRAVCEEASVPGVAVGDVVALKVMRTKEDDPDGWEKFERRTKVLASIGHPNVVKYYGCFALAEAFSSSYVVVMEFLEGESLKERLAANPGGLDADQALAIVNGALAGMAAAEAAGIVHRDIKPGNIFICRDGTPKLIDFEISRAADSSSISSTGRFAGTFDYMAPEFADEAFRGDARSDVFSMGVVLHEALTGATPYVQSKQSGTQADFAFLSRWSQRVEGICAIHVKSSVRRVLSHADEVLARALSEKREGRFASAAEFAEAMRAIRFRELRNGPNAYRLLKIIGRGGFGEVFKARLRSTGELVAVKHLLKSAYGDRFRREARVMKQLDDPAFVRFVDYFETANAGGGEAFLVMAFLPGMPGSSLRDAIKRHKTSPLPRQDVFRAFALYAQALAMMHGKGIYHRDIKPSNLYYPEHDPGKAAIMDLGIARDVNGTATAGQVPGTLDYMPPEVVIGGSRGDAGMDIYALGLCFYEALTGRMAYPRLPMGPDAFKAFYDRARLRTPPSFEGDELTKMPGLLELLKDMTALDPALRLHDANQLRRRILALSGLAGAAAVVRPKRPSAQSAPRATAVRRCDSEPETRGTTQTGMDDARRRRNGGTPDFGGIGVKIGWGLLAVVALCVGAMTFKCPIADWIERFKQNSEQQRIETIQARFRAEEELKMKAERERVADLRRQAETGAREVLQRIRTERISQLAAGNLAVEWQLRWRDNADVTETYRHFTGEFEKELSAKKERDRRETDRERARAEELARKQEERRKSDEAAERQKAIDEEERKTASQAEERALDEAEKLCVGQAKKLCARYADEKESPQAVNADRATWETNWASYGRKGFYLRAAREMREAQVERSLLESGRKVAAECDRWLANIGTVTAAEVANWQTYVDRARNELKRAVGEERISAKAASAVDRRIDACNRWVVGVIDNKTHETLDFCGTRIEPISSRVVIFREGLPEGAALACSGYEPIRVREDRLQSQAFLVLPRDLKETRGTTRAIVPHVSADVVCFIDGVQTPPGEVKLRRGRHHAVYRNVKETYGGVRDFKDQDVAFVTEEGGVVEISAPSGTWTPSAEFAAREKNSGLVSRGEKIVATVKACLKPEPVEGRRVRLQKAYAVINDWRTSEALAVLGEGAERELRALYEAERRRTRGIVRNESKLPARIETDAGTFTIASGESELVTAEGAWTGELHAVVEGYEFVMLPRVPSDFEKKPFVIRPEKLVPLPVAVTVPAMEKGVSCEVNGTRVSGTFELRPGTYEACYRKPDHLKQPFSFTVEIGKPKRLPRPARWEPSGAFSSMAEALSSFNSGALDKAKELTEKINGIEDPARRQELEDLKKAIELRERLNGASDARK